VCVWVLELTGAFQFGHVVGGFTANFIHSPFKEASSEGKRDTALCHGA
jgi:hypothetical protein